MCKIKAQNLFYCTSSCRSWYIKNLSACFYHRRFFLQLNFCLQQTLFSVTETFFFDSNKFLWNTMCFSTRNLDKNMFLWWKIVFWRKFFLWQLFFSCRKLFLWHQLFFCDKSLLLLNFFCFFSVTCFCHRILWHFVCDI